MKVLFNVVHTLIQVIGILFVFLWLLTRIMFGYLWMFTDDLLLILVLLVTYGIHFGLIRIAGKRNWLSLSVHKVLLIFESTAVGLITFLKIVMYIGHIQNMRALSELFSMSEVWILVYEVLPILLIAALIIYLRVYCLKKVERCTADGTM